MNCKNKHKLFFFSVEKVINDFFFYLYLVNNHEEMNVASHWHIYYGERKEKKFMADLPCTTLGLMMIELYIYFNKKKTIKR